ncbi:hypothetical protein BH20VER3_BH20VER3_09440 [soil metagenome]
MDLFDVQAPGYSSPLNRAEISHLFRAGHIGRRALCKPSDEATWRTVEEVFPWIKPARRSPSKRDARAQAETIKATAMGLVILGLFSSTIFHCWIQSAPVVTRASDRPIDPMPLPRMVAQNTPATASRQPLPPLVHGIIVADRARFR